MGRIQTGTIRKLPSGRWQVRYWTIDGRRITARDTFAAKADARLWLAAALVDKAAGVRVDARSGTVTLTEFAEAWLRDRAGISRRTREIYGDQLRRYILPVVDAKVPALGKVKLADLSPALIRSWYGALERARSHSIAAKAYVRLRQILRHAVDEDDRVPLN